MIPRSRRPGRAVLVEARAKLNLGLAVGPRRADGFHELATLFQSVTLADTLEITPRRAGFDLRVRHENAALRGRPPRAQRGSVPRGPRNLVLRAARLLARRAGIEGGARFRLIKRIPARAGLGGGSADAAAALAGLAALHGIRLSPRVKLALAAELGSDVPFAITGGTALGTGRGEALSPLALARPFRAVIAVPAWNIPTARAFATMDRDKKHLTLWRSNLRFAQVLGRDRLIPERALRLGNSFEASLGSRRVFFDSLSARLRAAGVSEVRMTGSGSAVFGVVPRGTRGSALVARFHGTERLYLVRSASRGIQLMVRS